MRFPVFFAALLAVAAPVAAKPAMSRNEAPAPEIAADAADVAAATTAYGQMIIRVSEVQAPVQQEMAGLQVEWQAILQGNRADTGSFRRRVAAIQDRIDRANAQLEALELPDVSALGLEGELEPPALVAEMVRVNREMRGVVGGFNRVLDAIEANDTTAAITELAQMMEGLRLVFESQAVTQRASMAVMIRENASWDLANIELLFIRLGARLFAAATPGLRGAPDPALAGDLLEIAAELEATAEAGEAKLDHEIAESDAARRTPRNGRPAEVDEVLGRVSATLEAGRGSFTLGRRLAGQLRSGVSRLGGGRVDMQVLVELTGAMREARAEFDRITIATGQAMSTGR